MNLKKKINNEAIPDFKKLDLLSKGLTQTIDCNSHKNLLSYNFVTNANMAKVNPYFGKDKLATPTIYSEDIIKLISAFFKSIYCLISRPKFINTPDKIIIEILYYITIPQNNIFKWYNFIYNTKKVIAFNYISALKGQTIPAAEATAVKLTTKNILNFKNEISRVNKKKLKIQKFNRLIKIILKKNSLIKKL